MSRNPLRWIFGGSDRRHHLRMSRVVADALAALGTYYNPKTEIAILGFTLHLEMPHGGLWLVAAGFCFAHEVWATADRDVEHKRKRPNPYWVPYDALVKHRGFFSHGIVIGTIARLAYGWFWLVAPLVYLAMGGSLIAQGLLSAIAVGAIANDLGHWLLDI
jgi:uncharacterized metal-binding protein